MFNNLNILFLLMTFSSTLISISSHSWIGAWMGLEMNMISFIPLIMSSKNILCNESALKYFLIQALASSSFLSFALLTSFFSLYLSESSFPAFLMFIFSVPLILKVGGAPFQFWFIWVMEGLPWFKCLILMTWQKIAPLFILFYIIKNNQLITFWAILSLFTGALGGLNQSSMKKILAYSSVNHIGWLLSSFLMKKTFLFMYLYFYTFLNLMVISFLNWNMNSFLQSSTSNLSLSFSVSLLSLGGLPPLLGFIPKWILLQNLVFNLHFFLSFAAIFSALITLFFYIRITFNNLILTFSTPKWNLLITNKPLLFLSILTISFNSSGLFMFNFLL